MGASLLGRYFNNVYNPVYDLIVNQVAPYHRLQQACIGKLSLGKNVTLLCAGIGTGNEAVRILEANPEIKIIGVDASATALSKAQKKANHIGKSIETHLMDVQNIQFADKSFDQALCVHVTDFVKDSPKACAEIIRVLKPGGKFAITFPSGKEDFFFVFHLMRESFRQNTKNRNFFKIPLVVFTTVIGIFVYLPLTFRKERRYYSKSEVEKLFSKLVPGKFNIEEFPVYNDFIVYGNK